MSALTAPTPATWVSPSTRALISALAASSSWICASIFFQVGGELLLQQSGFFFDARVMVVFLAAGFQGNQLLALITAHDQGFQGRFALGRRSVALGLHGRAEVAQDGSSEHIGFG